MINNKNNILIKSNSKEEKEYCKKYGIELHRLDNGVTIVGMSCGMDYVNWARIYWEFCDGSSGNMAGSVHFLEHLFNRKLRLLAEQNSLKLQATTGKIETKETVSGIANLKVMDYGIWTILGEIRKSLESPVKNLDNIESDIEKEKQIIKSEIQGRFTNHNFHVEENFLKTIYDPKNPWFNLPIVPGSEEEIDRITINDLIKAQNKVLIPKNLLISVYTEGDPLILKKAVKILKEQYSEFPRSEENKNEVEQKLLEKTNSNLKSGNKYEFDTKIKNGIITAQFIWIFKHNFPSKKYFTLKFLKNILEGELFRHSRKNAWGYYTNVHIARPTDNLLLLIMRVDIKKDITADLPGGITDVLNSTKTNTKKAVKLENKRQTATPLPVMDRFDWVAHGIKLYGKIIDADKMRKGMLSVSADELNEIIDEITSTPPITIITGDLS